MEETMTCPFSNESAKVLWRLQQVNFEVVTKRDVEEPNTSLLSEEQSIAFKDILTFLNDPSRSMHLLSGFAGTGKTFTISMLIEHLLSKKMVNAVAMTAPTNKAVKVMHDMANYKDNRLDYRTIHSLLGLKEQIDGYGNQKFVQLYGEECSIQSYSLVIIDEVSQLSDELFTLLLKYVKAVKILFVGDIAQIPPVGCLDCIPLSKAGQEKYGIGVSELIKIQRQSEGNPIIVTSMKIRNALGRENVLPVKNSEYSDKGDGVFYLDYSEDKSVIKAMLQYYYCSEQYKENMNFVKTVAWTNKTVDTLNEQVRVMIYGKDIPKVVIGERLIANKPIIDIDSPLPSKPILFTTNDEFEVVSIKIDTRMYMQSVLKFYILEVEYAGTYSKVRKYIKIIHEESEGNYMAILDILKEKATSQKKGTWEAAGAWKEFFRFQDNFADVNYAYAITCHKSQGSTYVNTFVINSDIDKNKRIVERNRIKYTAFTRSSSRLIVID